MLVGKQISLHSWQQLILVSDQYNFFNKSGKRNESTHFSCLVSIVYQQAMNAISTELGYFLIASCIECAYDNAAILE